MENVLQTLKLQPKI